MDDTLVNAEYDNCAAVLDHMEAALLAALNALAVPNELAVTGRYFAIAALLRLTSRLMVTALTEDPDDRHHGRYAEMLAEVSRRIAPWSAAAASGAAPSGRPH